MMPLVSAWATVKLRRTTLEQVVIFTPPAGAPKMSNCSKATSSELLTVATLPNEVCAVNLTFRTTMPRALSN